MGPEQPGRAGNELLSRGFTIVELMVSTLLLGLLMAAIFVIYFQGARAWRISDAHSEVQQQGTLLLTQLSKEIERSCLPGLSLGPQSLGLVSALDSNGQFQFTSAGGPNWTGFILFYKDAGDVVRRLDLAAPSQITPPRPIEDTDMGSGLNSFASYLSGGRSVARMVEDFTVATEPNNQGVRVEIRLSKPQANNAPAARLELDSTIIFRN